MADMESEYVVEVSKSDRSVCKRCRSAIPKGESRVGKMVLFRGNPTYQWHHLDCMSVPPVNDATLRGFLRGLPEANRKEVRDWFSKNGVSVDLSAPVTTKKAAAKGKKDATSTSTAVAATTPAKKKTTAATAAAASAAATTDATPSSARGRKRKADGDDAEVKKTPTKKVKAAPPPKPKIDPAKAAKEKKLHDDIVDQLSAKQTNELKELLRKNGQGVTGSKSELLERIADAKQYGCLPKCPSCGGGRLKPQYEAKYGHGGRGTYRCPGYMDDTVFRFCGATFQLSEITRPKWVD